MRPANQVKEGLYTFPRHPHHGIEIILVGGTQALYRLSGSQRVSRLDAGSFRFLLSRNHLLRLLT